MKRCIDCRWYSLSIMSDRCSNCKQVNPHKTTDHWALPASQKGTTAPPKPLKAPPLLNAYREIFEASMFREQREKKVVGINPMIVIEAKLK